MQPNRIGQNRPCKDKTREESRTQNCQDKPVAVNSQVAAQAAFKVTALCSGWCVLGGGGGVLLRNMDAYRQVVRQACLVASCDARQTVRWHFDEQHAEQNDVE